MLCNWGRKPRHIYFCSTCLLSDGFSPRTQGYIPVRRVLTKLLNGKSFETSTHPNKMADGDAKANRKWDFISIVHPLGVRTRANSKDQKECQQYLDANRLSCSHAGTWDSGTQCPALLVRCDVFQYCRSCDSLKKRLKPLIMEKWSISYN